MSAEVASALKSGDFSPLRSAIIFIDEEQHLPDKFSDDEICNQIIDSAGCVSFTSKCDEQGHIRLDDVEIVKNGSIVSNLSVSLTVLMPERLNLVDNVYYVKVGATTELSVMRLKHKSLRYVVYRCSHCKEVTVVKPSSLSMERKADLSMQAKQIHREVQSLRDSNHDNSSLLFSVTNCSNTQGDDGLPTEIIGGIFAAFDSIDRVDIKIVSLTLPSIAAVDDQDQTTASDTVTQTLIARALRLLSLLTNSDRPSVLLFGPCDNHHQLSSLISYVTEMKEQQPILLLVTWSNGIAINTQPSGIPSVTVSLATDNPDIKPRAHSNKTATVLELTSAMTSGWETLKGEIERRLLWPRCLPPLLLTRLGLSSGSSRDSHGQQQQQQQQVMGGWAVCGPANSGKTSFTLAILQQSSYLPALLGMGKASSKSFTVLQPSLAQVISGSIGGSESNLLQLCHEAISKAPAILILSEATAMLNLNHSGSGRNSMVAALLQGLSLLSSYNQQQLSSGRQGEDMKLVFYVLVWRGSAAMIPSALIRPDRLWPVITLLPSSTTDGVAGVFNPFVTASSAIQVEGGTNNDKKDARMNR